jgi:hypothetical protein
MIYSCLGLSIAIRGNKRRDETQKRKTRLATIASFWVWFCPFIRLNYSYREEAKIKLVVLEDQKILLDFFVSSLQEDFELVGAFDDADGLISFLGLHDVDVILADTCQKGRGEQYGRQN